MNVIKQPKIIWNSNIGELNALVQKPEKLEALTVEQLRKVARYAFHLELEQRTHLLGSQSGGFAVVPAIIAEAA